VSGAASAGSIPTATPFIARRERFAVVGSTNDVVRGWLADGAPEVCLAVADRQSAGRGRAGRTWVAPSGAALLLSLGFRPSWLAPDRTWQLAAVVALAMAEAAEPVAGLPTGTVRLKWPNDLVVEDGGPTDPRAGIARKLAGLLGETDGLGSDEPRATIGLGANVAWPASAFPADLAATMTSLGELSGGLAIDRGIVLDTFLRRLDPKVVALRIGRFDEQGWLDRQITTGRTVRLEQPDGSAEVVQAVGLDPSSGALLVADADAADGRRPVFSGEIRHLRLDGSTGTIPNGDRRHVRAEV
jgi:BirA family transcriptional regulator, biotin operon repressor / biotin---[acetyl-CoA-carboxylase] ligase